MTRRIAVAANTVFTTHTAVPAGHDHFAEHVIGTYFEGLCRERGIAAEDVLALGRMAGSHEFNMTALAVRGSRHHNGVSRIHGGVSAQMLEALRAVGGDAAVARVHMQPDERIRAIVRTWPGRFATTRADGLGFAHEADVDSIVRAYAREHATAAR